MALPASSLSPTTFQVRLFKCHPFQLHNHLQIRTLSPPTFVTCAFRLPTMANFHEPTRVNMYINTVKEKLPDVIPAPLKDFPWKKAEAVMLQRLLLVGQEAVKWSLVALFALTSVSDVIYSISRNRELMIPFGLFVGCMMADFLNETSQELFGNSEGKGLSRPFLTVGSFFVFVKIVSTFLRVPGQVFLLHVTNGALMQVLWLYRSLWGKQDRDNRDNGLTNDAAAALTTDD